MNIDKYIELAEKMVDSAENYVKSNCEFESFRGSMTVEEFEEMINCEEYEQYEKLQELEERLYKADMKIRKMY